MSEKKKTRSVEKSVTINAPAEVVWKAIAEAEGIKAWFSPDAQVTPGQGGKVMVSYGPGMEMTHGIQIWEPNKRLKTGRDPDAKEEDPKRAALAIDYVLEGKGGTTTLRLVNSGFGVEADWDDEFESVTRGWGVFLSNLKNYCERWAGRRCVQTVAMLPLTGSGADAFGALLGAKGFAKEGKLEGLASGAPFKVTTAAGDALEGKVAVIDAPAVLILDADNLESRIYVTVENSFLFAAVLSYGGKAEGLASRWQGTIEGALKA